MTAADDPTAADLAATVETLRAQLRERTAWCDWLVAQLCPHHNIECAHLGCPATPPGVADTDRSC